MNKKIKPIFAVLTVAFHLLTFSGPVHAIDIPEGTKVTVDQLPDGSAINVIGADGKPNVAGRGILEVMNQVVLTKGLDVVGIVALLSQMGIHIESTAQINVQGGLILSTLGINEAAFLAGLKEVAASRQSSTAMILNEGNIHLDANSFLVMLASAIRNTGDIAANGGTVIMAAGDKAVLSVGGDGLVNVEVTEPIKAEVTDFNGNKVSDVISNSGKISANGGFVKLTAKGSEALFDSIINHTGVIEAQTIGEKNGKIVLDGGSEGVVRENGILDASGRNAGEKGGAVQVLGDKVGLFEKARIDVSGDAGGGEVLVGGDYQGKGDTRAANFTYMDKSAQIWADALTSGNGGKVILWSNNTTRAYGTISAKGGAVSGNGGFVETSGKQSLDVDGISVNASAPNGAAGKWLLDPYNVTIVAGGAGTVPGGVFTPGADDSTIGATTIANTLDGGTDVEINTGVAGSQAGDIKVSAAIATTLGTAATLSLKAAGAISIGASISAAVGKTLNLILDAISGGITQTAALVITGTTSIYAGTNNVTLNHASNDFTGAVSVVSANNVLLRDTNAIDLGTSTVGGTLGVTANGAITESGSLTVTGTTTLAAGAANNILLNNGNNDFIGAVVVTNGKDVTLQDKNALKLGTSTVSGGLIVNSNGAITQTGGSSVTVTGDTSLTTGATNDITLGSSNNDFGGAVSVTSSNNVTLRDKNSLDLGVSNVTGNLIVTTGTTLTDSGSVTATALKFDVGTTVALSNPGDDFGTVSGVSHGTTTINDFNALTVGTVSGTDGITSGGNNIDVTAGGDLTLNKEINAGAGNVKLTTTGDIKDGNGASNNITGNLLSMVAGGSIGTIVPATPIISGVDAIETTVNNVEATATAGGVAIDNSKALTVGGVDAGMSGISTAQGAFVKAAGTLNVNEKIEASTANGMGLETTSGDINLAADLKADAAAGMGVSLKAAGKIDQTAGTLSTKTLEFEAGNTVSLASATNAMEKVRGTSNGTMTIVDKNDLTVNSGTSAFGTVLSGLVSNNNNINVTTGGNLTLDKAVNAGSGDANLTATGWIREGGPSDDAAPVADVIAKKITLNSNVASPGDALGQSSSYLDIQITNTATGSWNAGVPNGGNIYINCVGDCPIGQVDVGTGTFNFSASGALTDSNDTVFGEFNGGVWNIKAGGLNIKTGTGFGTATNGIELRLSDYGGTAGTDGRMAVNGGTGGVFASNASQTGAGLTIGNVAGSFVSGILSQAGTIILSGSPLTIAANVVDNAGGNITLAALGSTTADNLTLNNGIQVNATGGNGNVLMVAGNDVALKNNSRVTAAGTGTASIVSGEDYTDATLNQNGNVNGDIVMNSSSAVRSQNGNILVDAARNIKVAEVNADSDAAGAKGDVKVLSRSGRIEDNNGAALNITGNNLVLEAKKGIGVDSTNAKDAIETAVNTLDAVNHTSGHLEVDQVAAGGDLSVLRVDQQAANGDVDVRTLNGSMTVVAAPTGSGVSAKKGETTLEVNGVGKDLIVNNTVTSTTGKINLDSKNNDVIFSADGDVTATGGAEIEVSAQRNVTMANGTVFDANGGGAQGGIDIDAITGNVTLGAVKTTSALSTNLLSSSNLFDAVDINAGGAIIDGNAGAGNIVAKNGQTTLTAVTGIGGGGAIDTNIKALKLTNTTSGNVNVTENAAGGDLDVIQATQSGPGHLHIFTKNGNLTVLGASLLTLVTGGVSALSGETTLTATGAGKDLVVNNTVTSTTGQINLNSTNQDVIFDANGDVTATGGAEIAVTAQRNVTMADGTVLNANGGGAAGAINIVATTGNVTLGSVQTTSAASILRSGNAFDAVNISAVAGEIIDGGDTDVDIVAPNGQTTLRTLNGVGNTLVAPAADKAIETSIKDLDVINGGVAPGTGAGDINITEVLAGGPMNILRAFQYATSGKTFIQTQGGDLTVSNVGVGGKGVTAVDGTTTLYAAGGDLTIDNTINSADGKVQLFSDNNIYATAAGDVTAGDVTQKAGATGAEIEAEAKTGELKMTDGALWDAGNGQIDLDAQKDVTLGGLKTSNTTATAAVIVSRAGAIIDGGDTYTNIETGPITGGMLLSAKTGIGSTTHASPAADQGIETKGGKLAAFTESGDIQIFNTGALDINTIKDDNDPTTFFGSTGAGNVAGVTIKDPASLDPNSFIFITAASPMTVNSAVTNFDGGNVSLYALGKKPGIDTMTLNNDVRTQGGNGDIRIISGSDMTMAAGVTVSTAGNGVVSGTGNVIMGAGYDATGKAANQPAATLVGPGGVAGDIGANVTMTPTSTVATEDGDILVDAQNNFTVGLLHADGGSGKGDITDGVRGNVTTFSRNGSTLDADAAGAVPQLNNIFAQIWNATAGKDIGVLHSNSIETDAPIQNLLAGGTIDVVNQGNVLLNADATNGSIRFQSSGDILLGHAFAAFGANSLIAGGSILSQGGASTRVIGNDVIELIAGGIIGTTSNFIQTQLNHAGNLFLEAHGQQNGMSANIQGNFTRASVQFLNTPPGLVSFNGIVFGGATAPLLEASVSSLYFNPNPVSLPAYAYFNGRYAADFPAFFDQNRFAFGPATDINTAGIDVLPIEGLGTLPGIVPLPAPTPAPVPVPEAEHPPLTVPLPGLATAPVPQPTQDQSSAVYVAPGRGSDAAAPTVSGQQPTGLTGSDAQKKS